MINLNQITLSFDTYNVFVRPPTMSFKLIYVWIKSKGYHPTFHSSGVWVIRLLQRLCCEVLQFNESSYFVQKGKSLEHTCYAWRYSLHFKELSACGYQLLFLCMSTHLYVCLHVECFGSHLWYCAWRNWNSSLILSQESEVVNFSCCDEACQRENTPKGNMWETSLQRQRRTSGWKKWDENSFLMWCSPTGARLQRDCHTLGSELCWKKTKARATM